MLRNLNVGVVARFELGLDGQAATVVEVRKARFGLRPILHLWDDAAQREVARASGSWLSASTVLTYRNPHATRRRLTLVVRAGEDQAAGDVDLLRDGKVLERGVALRETTRDVASGPGFIYQAAGVPGGATKPWLYGLNAQGALVAVAEPREPLGMPRLSDAQGVVRVLVAAGEGSAKRGQVSLYANDRDDRDGDGLGRALERALGTCDGLAEPRCAHSPLGRYYQQVSHGTRDTDRDGIDDAAELFGVDTSASLDLPRYGADPRHKDVFVEVDYRSKLGATRLSEQDIVAIEQWFARGRAEDLKNPDAQPGVRLHLDVGFTPQDDRLAGLFGAWGGSSAIAEGSYTAASRAHMAAARRGTFRYALADAGGTGQSRADAFTFNVNRHRSRYFAHELGHTLGLLHHGERSFGVANCKPNYQSIMNYAYQNDDRIGFSSRTARAINPSRLLEAGALRGLQASMLAESPFEFDVTRRDVDWNRDGMIETLPVRGGVTWATYKSCGAGVHRRQALWEGEAPAATPVMVRTGRRLHVLWVDVGGSVNSRYGMFAGPSDPGSCLLADGDGSLCSEFSMPRVAQVSPAVKHIAAATLDDQRLVLATTGTDDQVRVQVMDGSGSAQPPGASPAIEIAQARSRHAPAVAWMDVDASLYGAARVLTVLWRGADDGTLMQAQAAHPGGPWVLRPVVNTMGQSITVGAAPSLLALDTGELCGVFPDADAFIRFYCYVSAQDAWLDLSARAFYAGLGPATSGQVGIAYHRYRYADGTAIDGQHARGAVYLSFTERNSHIEPDNPKFLVSAWLSTQRRAQDGIDFRWRGMVIDQWTNLAPNTGVALYEDEELSALKAVMAMRSVKGGPTSVTFLPLADGAQDLELGSGNDFQVMERGICRGIKPEAWCGDRSTAAY